MRKQVKVGAYIIMAVMMALMFVVFQMAVASTVWNSGWVSNYEPSTRSLMTETSWQEFSGTSFDASYILIAPEKSSVSDNIEKIMTLIKKPYTVYSSLDDMPLTAPDKLTALIICTGALDSIGSFDMLFSYLESGKDVIFATLPDIESANYKRYEERFGVYKTHGLYEQEGVDFLNKLLVTGIFFNVDVKTPAAKVTLNGTCLSYACGYDEAIVDYAKRNALIWRTFYGNGFVYVFNNTFLEDFSYSGIFIGVLSMDKEVYTYPIVNSSVVLVGGLPYFSNENDENMIKAYNRSSAQFQQDIVWNDLVSITKGIDIRYTLYPDIGAGQDEIERSMLLFFGKEISIGKHEIGIYPGSRFKEVFYNFKPTASNEYITDDTMSVVSKEFGDFGYTPDGYLKLPIVNIAKNTSNEDEGNLRVFRGFSMASAFGYGAEYIDISLVLKNPLPTDIWSRYKINFINGYYPIYKTYEYLDNETASEASDKLNIYLNCQPDINYSSDLIEIKADKAGTVSYIVRTLREITRFENCTVKKVNETDCYFVTVKDADARIYLGRMR